MTTNNDYQELHEDGAQNYPETLRLTVESAESAFDRAIERADTDGSAEEAVRSFESAAEMRRLLTDRRLEVIRTIMNDAPASITELAERLGRNYADVHADVELLAEHRIVYFDTQGRAKQPVIPYRTIEFDVTITADRSPV